MSSHGFHPFKGRISRHFADAFLSPDDAYLSYYDVRLTKEDVNCIKDDWLTDNAIAFWEEYLERQKLTEFPQANIVLLRPSMSLMLALTSNPLTLKDALPSFEKTTHIFLPINDCQSPSIPEGGSHWSLLLVSLIDGMAFHYDSLRPSNYDHALHACRQLSQLVKRHLRFYDLDDSPQQDNGSDCGVFVCMFMETLLLKRLLVRDAKSQISMSMRGLNLDANKGRKDMLNLIEDFRRQGRKSQGRSRSNSPAVSKDRSKSPPRVGN